MKKCGILSVLMLLCGSSLVGAQETATSNPDSSVHFNKRPTAFSVERGFRQIGLFSDAVVGLNDQLTLFVHPLMIFAAPTAELMVTWGENVDAASSYAIASYHRLGYPVPLMKLLQMEGDLGIITPEVDITTIVSFTNGIRYSQHAFDGMLTLDLGVEVAFGDPDVRTSVDLPIIYPRMVAFYDGWLAGASVTYEQMLGDSFGAALTTAVGFNDTKFFAEITPRLSWHIDDTWSLHLDPVVTYGTYPYGNDWQLIILPDLTYRF